MKATVVYDNELTHDIPLTVVEGDLEGTWIYTKVANARVFVEV